MFLREVLHLIELEFRNVDFEERGKPENPEKNLLEESKEPTANLIQITMATWVGGKCNHHYAIPAPLFEFTIIFKVSILMRISKTSIIEPCNNIILVYLDCIVLYRLKWNSMSSSEKAKLKATALHLVGEVCEFEKHY